MVSQKKNSKTKGVNYKKLALEYKNTLQRLQAEFENYRNRSEQEKRDLINSASKELVINLLGVLDSIDLAVKNSSDKEGFELIRKQFIDLLSSEGLEEIKTTGTMFSTEFHEVLMSKSSEEVKGTVLENIRKGYTFGGKVIRPANVIISKGNEGEENE